ncbi:MAG: transposase [Bacteroidota bacterium]
MTPFDYFTNGKNVYKRRYDALRAFFYDRRKAEDVAEEFGYTLSAFYSLSRDFGKHLNSSPCDDLFFKEYQRGRKPAGDVDELNDLVIDLRKLNYSTQDIVTIANSKNHPITYGYVYQLLKREGFAKLSRRSKLDKENLTPPKICPPVSKMLEIRVARFTTGSAGLLFFLPYLKQYGIDTLITESHYPETKAIGKLSSILSFIALKLSNVRRYSCDDLWCMDRGAGMFAGLNVLPKSAWLSSYSHRVTGEMNLNFLKGLHIIWQKNDLLSDTSNIDFTTIPYWGDDSHLENNWSGKRNKAMSSMLAVLAQDPESGIIDYGNTNVMHENESQVVLEYLDFYRTGAPDNSKLKYLVFDSKFTNYQNLGKLDDEGIKFLTIRRRGKNIVQKINSLPAGSWKKIRIEASGLKKRTLRVYEKFGLLKGYSERDNAEPRNMRQINITGNGKIKPAIIITNDFDLPIEKIVRKYARRWLVEKAISEQIEFFHLNSISSSIVIKVDFDFVMSIFAHNLYRLFALDLKRYSHFSDIKIYEKFIDNSATISIEKEQIRVELKKKRALPQILELFSDSEKFNYEWIGNKPIEFLGASTS